MRDNLLKALAKSLFFRTGSVRRVAFGPLRGMRYRVNEITGLSPWYSGVEREHQKAFKQLVGKGDTAIDVGANWGLHVLYLSKLVGPRGRVVAVEPFPAAMHELEWHLRTNRCSNVEALPLALSDRDGQAAFTTGDSAYTGHLSSLDSGAFDGGVTGSEAVSTRTLDSLVDVLHLKTLKLVKIDVEGAESMVLEGAGATLQQLRPFVVVDLHTPEQDARVARLLTTHGYTLERLSPGPAIRDVHKGWPDPEGVWGTILGRPAASSDVQRGRYFGPLSTSAADGDGVGDRRTGVLGLFPKFEGIGGVQASGRVAWRGIVETPVPALGKRYLILYDRGCEKPRGPRGEEEPLVVSSRLGAVAAAVGRRWPVRLVIVWHLDLLKYLFVLRARKAETVVFLHGIEAWRRQSAPVRILLRGTHRILSNSDHTWQQFVQHNPACRSSRHRTVHLGIGEPLQGEIPGPARTPIALMIGRLLRSEDYKGHREVIDAWPHVVERVSGAELWIVGDGDLRADLETMVRDRGMTGHVRFLGALPDAARDEVLLRSRCLLMPSRGEGFGLVYLEAMRVGRPCLVSTLDAGREVINPPEAGLAVDPADTRRVADAVSRLLTPGEEWDGWSIRARQRYEERFTAVHFEQRLVAALSEVVGGNGSAT